MCGFRKLLLITEKKTNETEPIIVGDDVAILLFLTSVKYCVQTQHMISIEACVSE